MSKVYEIVTDQIVKALERGVVPWSRPWSTSGLAHANIEGRPYRGVNPLLLAAASDVHGFTEPYWATYKQAQKRGGQVRKGEKGSLITFYKVCEKEQESGDIDRFYLLRYFRVFNVAQIDGLEWSPPQRERFAGDPIDAGEQVIDGMPNAPQIEIKPSDRAFYRPSTDTVTLPEREQYERPADFYRVAFHELAHSTGHESRLNRDLSGRFGTGDYAAEELVAEIGAAMVCGAAGIDANIEQSAAYIDGWRQALSDDPRLIVTAASAAQKAADYILGEEVAGE